MSDETFPRAWLWLKNNTSRHDGDKWSETALHGGTESLLQALATPINWRETERHAETLRVTPFDPEGATEADREKAREVIVAGDSGPESWTQILAAALADERQRARVETIEWVVDQISKGAKFGRFEVSQ